MSSSEKLTPEAFFEFLSVIEKLKCNTRHSYTSSGRRESVAEHSFRLAVAAYLLKDEIDADMDRVLEMCLVHDFGEAVCGDIPSFLKTESDEDTENAAVLKLLRLLPQKKREHMEELFKEMWALESPEARVFKALDKLEAVMSHNDADLSTWIPEEYEMNLTYGIDDCAPFELLKRLREKAAEDTRKKIGKGEK